MADTRPSGHPLLPNERGPVFQEVSEVDTYRRINLLQRWTSRFHWLENIKTKSVDVLMVLAAPGMLKLMPWEPEGPRLLKLHETISQDVASDETLEVVRLIRDKYERLTVDHEHRPYLGDPALAHLGLPLERGVRSIVYVAIYPDYIAILSQDYRNQKLLLSNPLLDSFPR
jgi:hypothetical protein